MSRARRGDRGMNGVQRGPLPLVSRATVECGPDRRITGSEEAVPLEVVEVMGEGVALCPDRTGEHSEVLTKVVDPVVRGE